MCQPNQNSLLQPELRGIDRKYLFIKYQCLESLGENNFEIIKIKIIA